MIGKYIQREDTAHERKSQRDENSEEWNRQSEVAQEHDSNNRQAEQ